MSLSMYRSLAVKITYRILNRMFNLSYIDKNLQIPAYILGNNYGYINSKYLNKSVNSDSEPILWFTYPAIEYISQLDLSDMNVFEWGSGYSTLFFEKRCKKIIS